MNSPKSFIYDPNLDPAAQFERMYRLLREDILQAERPTVSVADVSDPPTDTELDTIFGTPARLGAGYIGIIDDNSADTDVWLCYTSDTSWFYLQGTKAL